MDFPFILVGFIFLAIVYIAMLMSWAQQYDLAKDHQDKVSELKSAWGRHLGHLAFALFLAIVILNVVTIFLQCGGHECSDDSLGYVILGAR